MTQTLFSLAILVGAAWFAWHAASWLYSAVTGYVIMPVARGIWWLLSLFVPAAIPVDVQLERSTSIVTVAGCIVGVAAFQAAVARAFPASYLGRAHAAQVADRAA